MSMETTSSSGSSQWYKNLNKSGLTPPSWVFGVVWPLLYTSIGVYYILMILYTSCSRFECTPLIIFTAQMILNFLWPPTFFNYKKPKIAFIILLFMVGLTISTLYYSFKINESYTYILIPYTLWISFASYLNGYIVLNN